MRTSLVILTMLAVALLLAANSAFAVVNSPLNGGFEDPDEDPAYTLAGTPGVFRSTNAIDNWDQNTTLEVDTENHIMSHPDMSKWRYGGPWSPYVEENGDSLLGLASKWDWAYFAGVQQDLGTMDVVDDTYTLGATLYGHIHSDENTVWGTAWENCDAITFQIVFYNVNDGVVLKSLTDLDISPIGFKGGYVPAGGTPGPETVEVSMVYTAQASDVGDTLRLLLLPRAIGGGVVTHCGIDDVTVLTNVIPPVWLPGDANTNGIVDEVDASILASNWQKTGNALWSEGDFNGDGNIDDIDAALLATNWQINSVTTVPEPTTLVLLTGVLLCFLPARKRRLVA